MEKAKRDISSMATHASACKTGKHPRECSMAPLNDAPVASRACRKRWQLGVKREGGNGRRATGIDQNSKPEASGWNSHHDYFSGTVPADACRWQWPDVSRGGTAATRCPGARFSATLAGGGERGRRSDFVAEVNAALGQIVGRHFQRHAVTRQNADAVLLHLARGIGPDFHAVFQRH